MKQVLKKLLFLGLIAGIAYAVYRFATRERAGDWMTAAVPDGPSEPGVTSPGVSPSSETEPDEDTRIAGFGDFVEAHDDLGPVLPEASQSAFEELVEAFEERDETPEPPSDIDRAIAHEIEIPAPGEEMEIVLPAALDGALGESVEEDSVPATPDEPGAVQAEESIPEPEREPAVEPPVPPPSRFQESLLTASGPYVATGDGDVLWRGTAARAAEPAAAGFFSDAPEYAPPPKAVEPELPDVEEVVPHLESPSADAERIEEEPLEEESPAGEAPHVVEASSFAEALGVDPGESIEEKFERFTREQEQRRAAEAAAFAEAVERELEQARSEPPYGDSAPQDEPVEPEPTATPTDMPEPDWRTRAEEFTTAASVPQPLPPSVPAAAEREAESYLDEGNVYFQVGQYQLAVERYNRALELAPDLVAVLYNRANALTRVGEYDAALDDYNRAVALEPTDADALNNRGMLHLYRGAYDEALADFSRALEVDPSDTTVLVNRGLALLHNGNPSSALEDFERAARLDPQDPAALYSAAQACAMTDDRRAALSYLARAFELDPAYAREASADDKLVLLQGDEEFMRLLRDAGGRSR